MKIIEQSHELLMDGPDLSKQIEARGRICCQSEGKITGDSHKKFVKNIIDRGHNSVLEMGRITLFSPQQSLCSRECSQFITFSDGYYSGSVRAWLEDWDNIPFVFQLELQTRLPNVFGEKLTNPHQWNEHSQAEVREYPESGPDYMLHKYQAVKFTTNRAMTHELVRHRPCSFLQQSQRYVRYDKPEGIEFIRPLWWDKDRDKDICRMTPEQVWLSAMITSEEDYIRLLQLGLAPQQARGVLPNDTATRIIVYTSLAEWRHIFFMRTQGGADPQMKALMIPVLEDFRKLYPGRFDELKASVAGR